MITAYGEYKTDNGFQRLTTVAVDVNTVLKEINSWHRDYTLSWAWIITGKGHREKLTLENGVWVLSSMASSLPSTAHPHSTQAKTEDFPSQPVAPLSKWRQQFASLSPHEKDALRLKWRTRYANMDPEKKAKRRSREKAQRKMRIANMTPEEKAARLKRERERALSESPEHRQIRLVKKREYNRKYRSSLTESSYPCETARATSYGDSRAKRSTTCEESRLVCEPAS